MFVWIWPSIYVFCVDMAYGLYTYLELHVESRFEVKKT